MNDRIKMGAIEMYESPISIEHVPPKIVWDDFTDTMAKAGAKKLDEMILKSVGEVKVNVDPDELEKALQYDRDQFQKGFAAGVEWAGQKWISVEDRLPEAEKEVLCYLGNSIAKATVVAFRRNGEWYFDGWTCPTVTHWMPLPEAPKEE